jgi:PTH1 family peptidyl-tRNA hydrolase
LCDSLSELSVSPSIKAVFGLGNPGEEFARTRHNLGCMLADRLAGDASYRRKGEFAVSESRRFGRKLLIGKPLTYMNLNGKAVGELMRRYSLHPSDLLVAYDDIDLALGRIRMKPGGGSGGHKGMTSVIQELQTDRIARIRLGIRTGGYTRSDAVGFVLSAFEEDERAVVERMLDRAVEAVRAAVEESFARAMTACNRVGRCPASGVSEAKPPEL